MQVSIDSASAGQTILYSVQRSILSGRRAVPLFQSHHLQNITIAMLPNRPEIQLSPTVLDMGYVLLIKHLLHMKYCCILKTGCIDAMFTAGANSTPSKRAQFLLPCKSTHTTSSDNLLLYFEGTFATLWSMSLAS